MTSKVNKGHMMLVLFLNSKFVRHIFVQIKKIFIFLCFKNLILDGHDQPCVKDYLKHYGMIIPCAYKTKSKRATFVHDCYYSLSLFIRV